DDEGVLRRPGDRGADADLRAGEPPARRVPVLGRTSRPRLAPQEAGGSGARKSRAGARHERRPLAGLRRDRPGLPLPPRAGRRPPRQRGASPSPGPRDFSPLRGVRTPVARRPAAAWEVHASLLAAQTGFALFPTLGKIALTSLSPLPLAALRVASAALLFEGV